MADLDFVKCEKFLLKEHPTLNEKWVQDQIALDPAILGLGDLVLRDKERAQPHAGRLDILLQDPESNRRYEVEVQLGKTDESHIIRTLEYWDIERKRYPQYDHCAVIVAEDITARFLNVISLFNGTIPIIAIQMNGLKVGQQTTLVFTTVLGELSRGLVDEDEEQEPTDRPYWEERGTKATLAIADELLKIIKGFDQGFELNFTKFYIGLARDGQPNNFAVFTPQRTKMWLEVRLDQSDEVKDRLEKAGLDLKNYDSRSGRYCMRLTKADLDQHSDVLKELLRESYQNTVS